MSNEQDKQHLQELAAYSFTVENLRARVAELEAKLAAAQKAVPAVKSGRQVIVDSGALQMVLNALERDALEGKQVRAEMRLELMQSINHPTKHGLDSDKQRNADIGKAIMRACKELPEGAEIQIYLERGAGTVNMTDCDGNEFDHFDEAHNDFACRINAATDGAIAAEQFAAQAKQGEQAK